MSDSQSYAAIMSHDVDIVPFIDLVLSPVVMSSKAVVRGNQNVKSATMSHYCSPSFKNSCISAILRVTSIKNRAVSEYNMDLEPYYLKS